MNADSHETFVGHKAFAAQNGHNSTSGLKSDKDNDHKQFMLQNFMLSYVFAGKLFIYIAISVAMT